MAKFTVGCLYLDLCLKKCQLNYYPGDGELVILYDYSRSLKKILRSRMCVYANEWPNCTTGNNEFPSNEIKTDEFYAKIPS